MARSGHEQLLNMAGEGRGKVDKTIEPPTGFGVVDEVFRRFQQRWKDEWRRRMGSQAGCDAIAREWLDSLHRCYEGDVRKAVDVCLDNSIPPTLVSFISYVERAAEIRRQPVKVNREYGRQQLENIKRNYLGKETEVKH